MKFKIRALTELWVWFVASQQRRRDGWCAHREESSSLPAGSRASDPQVLRLSLSIRTASVRWLTRLSRVRARHRPATTSSSSSHHTPLHSITGKPVRHDAQSQSVHPNPPLARTCASRTRADHWPARTKVKLDCARGELRPPSDFVQLAFLTYFV